SRSLRQLTKPSMRWFCAFSSISLPRSSISARAARWLPATPSSKTSAFGGAGSQVLQLICCPWPFVWLSDSVARFAGLAATDFSNYTPAFGLIRNIPRSSVFLTRGYVAALDTIKSDWKDMSASRTTHSLHFNFDRKRALLRAAIANQSRHIGDPA